VNDDDDEEVDDEEAMDAEAITAFALSPNNFVGDEVVEFSVNASETIFLANDLSRPD
jgi:hypothetical protein